MSSEEADAGETAHRSKAPEGSPMLLHEALTSVEGARTQP